jgi:hypothetical protein
MSIKFKYRYIENNCNKLRFKKSVISKNITKMSKFQIRRWYTNSGKITDIIKSSRQVKKISNWIIVKSSPPTDNSDMPTPTKTNFSGMKFSDPYSDIHPPLNSFLSGYKRGNSAKLPPCLPAQTKLTGIVAITKIIPNPFPHL